MPDPSDSPAPGTKAPADSPAERAPEPVPGVPGSPVPEALSLVPRSRSGSAGAKESAGAVEAEGAPTSFNDFMQWMKTFVSTMETAPAETTKPGARLQRSTLPKEQRKFQRFDREPGASQPPAAPVTPVTPTVPESQSTDERTAATAEDDRIPVATSAPVPIALTGGTSGRRIKPGKSRPGNFWLWLQLGAVVLLAISFFLGRASVPKTQVTPKSAAAAPGSSVGGAAIDALDPEAARLIDEAMAAEQDEEFAKASALLLEVQKKFPRVRDVDFRLANIALEENDASKAMPLLLKSIAENEATAASYKLRATIINRRDGINRGMDDFATATRIDPFSAENFYFWGEALRRAGKPQAALVKLQQAIDRLREPALESLYRLKLRLTQVELGQEKEFAAEMAQKLAENPPPPDWLLTAAAVDLQHRNIQEAAGYLDKALQLMGEDTLAMRMRDYFFFSYRLEKPLAKFFAFAAPQRPAAAPLRTGTAAAPDTGTTAPPNVLPSAASSLLPGTPAARPAFSPAGTP